MSEPSNSADVFPPETVVVIDTSVLIAWKRIVPLAKQFALLNLKSSLVAGGHIAFPRQVPREMAVGAHPDAPGVWIVSCSGHCRYPEPEDESVAEVLGVAQLVDTEAESEAEAADPYIAAMALEIRDWYPQCKVVVATEDRVDRMPIKESLTTACERLDITCWRAQEYADWIECHQT